MMEQLISPDDALELVLRETPTLSAERMAPEKALGCVIAEDIEADRDYPPFDRAMMDGFAVRMADAGKTVAIAGEIAAGIFRDVPLRDGEALEIMTGAPCPPGTEAVAEKEIAGRTGDAIRIPGDIKKGRNIATAGGECKTGNIVLKAGTVANPMAIAVMATFGIGQVMAIRRPGFSIITTGNEIVAQEGAVGRGQIRNSNGPMLAALGRLAGMEILSVLHAADEPEALGAALASSGGADIVALCGGVSEGKFDLVPGAIEAAGGRIVFHKVAQRPGKPLLFSKGDNCLYFGLPGNPLSAHLCFHRYIRAACRKLMGLRTTLLELEGALVERIENKGSRVWFALARAEQGGNSWSVQPCGGKGSADIYASAGANAIVRIEPGRALEQGAAIRFNPISNEF